MLFNNDFLTWHLMHSCQPIGSQFWKFLLNDMDLDRKKVLVMQAISVIFEQLHGNDVNEA